MTVPKMALRDYTSKHLMRAAAWHYRRDPEFRRRMDALMDERPWWRRASLVVLWPMMAAVVDDRPPYGASSVLEEFERRRAERADVRSFRDGR